MAERIKRCGALVLWAVLVVGCARPPTPRLAPKGSLVVFSDLRGTLKPCGCSPDLRRGGVARIAAQLAKMRASSPRMAVLHAGDLLLDDEGMAGRQKQIERRTAALAAALKPMRIAAATLGPNDLAAGLEWLRREVPRLPVAVVATNVTGAAWEGWTRRSAWVKAGGLRVGVIGLVPSGAPGVTEPVAAAQAAARRLRAEGANLVVALSGLGLRKAKRLLRKRVGVDLLVAGGQGITALVSDEAELIGGSWLVQSFIQGGQLGRLDVDLSGRGPLKWENSEEAPTAGARRFRYGLTPIGWDLPRDPTVAAVMAAYDADLKAINLSVAGTVPPVPPGAATYVGVDACLNCHDAVEGFWKKTPHSRAWETLEHDGKTFDLECVSCHVTGYGQPGGSVLGALNDLEDVQCEACHGPGSLHAEAGEPELLVSKVSEATCTGCHTPKHSTGFEYEKYRRALIVPGHGKPAQ